MARLTNRHIAVREHESIAGLDDADQSDLKDFVLANLAEDGGGQVRPVLGLRNGQLHARNHVGIIETQRGTTVEILPKVELSKCEAGEDDTRKVFLKMLRAYRALRFAQLNRASITALRRFNMLNVFVRLFLEDLQRLTQRGLARRYQAVEDNLPCLRGRIQFAEHIRRNASNGARFYVRYDEFTADRPVNRLIRETIHHLRAAAHPDDRQLLHQLRVCFADVPRSARPQADWDRHRIDRQMSHYETVMAWVGLFLFNHGLATFAGRYVNRALLFPMEQVFEDFVVDAFRRHQGARAHHQRYSVLDQRPQLAFAKDACAASNNDSTKAFKMKPDISLMRGDRVAFVLDAKWKALGGDGDPRRDIVQGDVYQLYSYGRKFGCSGVALVYPKTTEFGAALHFKFIDEVRDQPLEIWCFPFDVGEPCKSVAEILADLERSRRA